MRDRESTPGDARCKPSSIRAAARVLYSALRNTPFGHDLDPKLEKERADSDYFEQLAGPLEYFDSSDRSYKSPLVSSS